MEKRFDVGVTRAGFGEFGKDKIRVVGFCVHLLFEGKNKNYNCN